MLPVYVATVLLSLTFVFAAPHEQLSRLHARDALDCATVRSMAETRATQLNVTLEQLNVAVQDRYINDELLRAGSLTLSAQSDIDAVADVANNFTSSLPDTLNVSATYDNIEAVNFSDVLTLGTSEDQNTQDLINQGADRLQAWQVDARTALDTCNGVANGTVPRPLQMDASTTQSDGSIDASAGSQSSESFAKVKSGSESLLSWGWSAGLVGSIGVLVL